MTATCCRGCSRGASRAATRSSRCARSCNARETLMPSGTAWTEAMIARLRALHAEEEYFSDIARILSQEFGVELTKNSCIGKGAPAGPERAGAGDATAAAQGAKSRRTRASCRQCCRAGVVEPPMLPARKNHDLSAGAMAVATIRSAIARPTPTAATTRAAAWPGARTTSGWSTRAALARPPARRASGVATCSNASCAVILWCTRLTLSPSTVLSAMHTRTTTGRV